MKDFKDINRCVENLIELEENFKIDLTEGYLSPQDLETGAVMILHQRIFLYQIENQKRQQQGNLLSPFDFFTGHMMAYLKNENNPIRSLVCFEIESLIDGSPLLDSDSVEKEFIRSFINMNFEIMNMELKNETNLKLNFKNFNTNPIFNKLDRYPVSYSDKLKILVCSIILTYNPDAKNIEKVIGNKVSEEYLYDFYDSTVLDCSQQYSEVITILTYLRMLMVLF